MSFTDVLAGNARHAATFTGAGITGSAARGLGILCCMDSRLDPLAMLDIEVGDAKVLRTPGGRLTPDALTGFVVGSHVLGIDRIMVIAHTRCAMGSGDDASVIEQVRQADGTDLSGMRIGSTPDQVAGLRHDVTTLREHRLVDAEVGGFRYDVDDGRLTQLV